jgi:regulator of protease activity HflC (stomatin/prohibitin superfamily)
MQTIVANPSREREVSAANGWMMGGLLALAAAGAIAMTLHGLRGLAPPPNGFPGAVGWLLSGLALDLVVVVCCFGFFTLEPNQARVLVLFGKYHGTVRRDGFHWANPFYSNGPSAPQDAAPRKPGDIALRVPKRGNRLKISLRARNLNGDRLKVNDKNGNPIEIAAVIVWRVEDTAQALFDVDNYEEYVRIQSESALRHLGSQYAYDHGEEYEVTLRSGVAEVSQALARELDERLAKAGVTIEEARLTHLAYAPEIAQAMLRRQQAEAVLAARRKIVLGAVGMVQHAIQELSVGNVIDLDPERRAAMAGNLMVVLCGDSEARPVINTGTLY